MQALLLLAIVISFLCDRFLCLRWIFYSSRLIYSVLAYFYRLLEARVPLGLRLLLVSLLPTVVMCLVLFVVYRANFVLYLALLVFCYLLLVPFRAFISDYQSFTSHDGCANDKFTDWLEMCNLVPSAYEQTDSHSAALGGLVLEQVIVAPLLWSILLGPLGLFFYFFTYKTKIFADSHSLESAFFDKYFELVDWIPSRFLIFMMCLLTHFSRFVDQINWMTTPFSSSCSSRKFLLSSVSLLLTDNAECHVSSTTSGQEIHNKSSSSVKLFSRTYQVVMLLVALLLVIQGTIVF